jgi:hypothetical protein
MRFFASVMHGTRDERRRAGVVAAILSAALLTAAAAPIPASQLLLSRHDANLDFEWAAGAHLATQPSLLVLLRASAERRLKAAGVVAAEDRRGRPRSAPFFKHQFSEAWSRAAETPALLVLTAETDTYTGGAHGMHTFDVAIWDKKAQRRIAFSALFTDWPKARALLTKPYCAALDEERARRRSEPSTMFNDCPAIDKEVIVPQGGIDGRINGLQVRLAPYDAGPYAEGSYELQLDMPDAVVALVKPAYRPAFGYRP